MPHMAAHKANQAGKQIYGDPLMKIVLPDVVRKHSAEVHQGAIDFEEHMRSLFAKSNEVIEAGNEEPAREYVNSRQKTGG